MRLARPTPPRALISLVPLVDVLLIMLVFFMVTSTYLDLDMIPAARADREAAGGTTAASGPEGREGGAGAMLIRLAPDGRTWLRGRPVDAAGLRAALAAHRRDSPGAAVNVLAAPRANVQALVALMDLATEEGVTRLQVLRTEPADGGAP